MVRGHGVLLVVAILAWTSAFAARGAVVDFEDLTLSPESFYNGADGAGSFASRGTSFNNAFTDFGGGFTAWEGWAYSNVSDNATPGFGNQYSAFPGAGHAGSEKYGVGFTNTFVLEAPIITLPDGMHPVSLRASNATYAALSMKFGDPFAKKFGGASGDDPDWFRLTITGRDENHAPLGSVEFYLADYRAADNAQDYILDHWQNVNLASLFDARELVFSLASTDNGTFGMNTPAYFVLDDLSLTGRRGDLNDDGRVDLVDVQLLGGHWQEEGPLGDANGDGRVDLVDVQVVGLNWSASLPPAARAVPEPPAFILAALAGLGLAAARRRVACAAAACSPERRARR